MSHRVQLISFKTTSPTMFPFLQRSQQHGFVISNIRGHRISSLRLFPFSQRKALVSSSTTSTPPPTTPITTTTTATAAAKTRTSAKKYVKKASDEGPTSRQLMFHAGLPIIAFSLLATWVIKNSLEGKTKEHEVSIGKLSRYVKRVFNICIMYGKLECYYYFCFCYTLPFYYNICK
jgi:hypothetical protein